MLENPSGEKTTIKSNNTVLTYFPAPGSEIKAQSSKAESVTSTEISTVTLKKQDKSVEVTALHLLQDELRGKLQSKLPADTSFIELV